MNNREMASYEYNNKGLLTSEKRYGEDYFDYYYHTTVASGAIGKLYRATDAIGRQTHFFNYKRGRPERIRRADLSNLYQTVDDNGWVTSSTDPRGNVTSYGHDSMGRVTSITPPSSWDSTSISYDFTGGGAVQTINKGNDNTQIVTYDSLLRPVLEQSSTSLVTAYTRTEYDALGRVAFQSRPSTSSNPTSGTNYEYDGLGRILSATDTTSNSIKTTHIYGPSHRHQVSDTEGGRTDYYSHGYDGPGNKSYRAIYKYDNNSLTQKTNLAKNVWGQLTSVTQTDSSGYGNAITQTYTYDSRQRLCRKTVPEEGPTQYAYNDANELIAYSVGVNSTGCGNVGTSNARVDLTYDLLGRPLNTLYTDPDTPDIRRTYWPNSDNIRTVWRDHPQKGNVRWNYYYHDDADLVDYESLKIDGQTYIATYEYDSSGALKQERLPSGRRIDYTSDGAGRFDSIKYGSTTLASNFSYHPNGALAGMSLGNGQNFTQTLNNRQLTSGMYSVKGNHVAIDQTYGYNARGLMTSMIDNATNIGSANENNNRSYDYDGLGRLTSASGPWGMGMFEYDGLNNLRKKTLGTRTVDLTYTSANRLETSVDNGNSGTRDFSHDGRGNVTAITRTNPIHPPSTSSDGIRTRKMVFAPKTRWEHTAKFSADGNSVKSLTSVASDPVNLEPGVTNYYFDNLTIGVPQKRYSHLYTKGGGYNGIVEVTAELVGNLNLVISHRAIFNNGAGWTGPTVHQGQNVETPWHDVGTDDANLTFTYDYSDQPVTVSGKANGEYLYDGNMKRVKAVVNGKTFHYVYNSRGRLSYVHEVSTPGSSKRTEYVAGPQGNLARFDSWKLTYLHPDHLGSVQSGTDTLGRVMWREKFTPFGEEITSPAANDNKAGFTGHIKDKASGLNYMQARYYDPVVGRFLSIDPVGFLDTGEPGMFNRYAYVYNDPINGADPTGMYCDVGSACSKVANAIRNALPGPDNAQELVDKYGQPPSDIGQTMASGQSISSGEMQVVGALTAALGNASVGRIGPNTTAAPSATRSATATAQGADEVIYVVPGAATKSNKPYVGRTSDFATRSKHSADGRDRSQATIVGRASSRNARSAEQNAMNRRGGVGKLDNKRNEISSCKWGGCGVNPPD